jgi:hypothetical protein
LLAHLAAGTPRGISRHSSRRRRSRRHGEVARLQAGQLFLVQLGCSASGHRRWRMCSLSGMVSSGVARGPVRGRHRGAGISHRSGSRRGPGRWCRIWQIPRGARRQVGQRRGGARPAWDRLIRAGGTDPRTGPLRPDWCGNRERGNNRNAVHEVLHVFDPPLQFRIGQGIYDAGCTLSG